MADTEKIVRFIVVFLAVFQVATPLKCQGFDTRISLLSSSNAAGGQDSIFHNTATQSIDFLLEAWHGKQQFWDFHEDNLLLEEEVNGLKSRLEIVFQGKVRDEKAFGDRDVYLIKTRSSNNYHRGSRTYHIRWKSPQTKETLAEVSVKKDWSLLGAFSLVERYSRSDLLMAGLAIIAVLLLVFSEFIPWLYVKRFIRKFVTSYSMVQKEGQRKLHPITGRPLQANEMVVKMCNREICGVPLSVWKRRNYQCLHCPEKCDGNANIWTQRFFSQVGDAKKLNWLWFGAAGGLLAWFMGSLAQGLLPTADNPLVAQSVFGFSVGLGFTLLLALTEELGQGRALSLGRLLIRTLMGATLGALLFGGAAMLGEASLWGALAWLCFCVLLGLVLSFRSSIRWTRGILSGLLAGLASALAYYFLPLLSPDPEAELVKLLTLLVAGATLGFGIIQVVKRLEQVELQVISPSIRSGLTFSLDNFLQAGTEILIGKDMKRSTVRVKWDDEQVLALHAAMRLSGQAVSIYPLSGAEIWVDNQRFTDGNAATLHGGETIALSRNGQTAFKYLQRKA